MNPSFPNAYLIPYICLAMNRLLPTLTAALFLAVLLQASDMKMARAKEQGEEQYIKDCLTNSTCGGMEIRYPFRLQGTPSYCGVPELEAVSCSAGGDPFITLPKIGSCKLLHINYLSTYYYFDFLIQLGESWARCPLQNLASTNLTNPIYDIRRSDEFVLVNCSGEIKTEPNWITGPINCLGRSVYVASAYKLMDDLNLPRGCEICTGDTGMIPFVSANPWEESVSNFIKTRQMPLYLTVQHWDACGSCRRAGQYCGFNHFSNYTFCMSRKTTRANKQEEEDYVKDCLTNSTCGGIEIRYPFRLEDRPPYCGVPGLEAVSCSSGGDAFITLPNIGSSKLLQIDYFSHQFEFLIQMGGSWTRCPLQNLSYTNPNPIYEVSGRDFITANCSGEIKTDSDRITGPIDCLGRLVYVASANMLIDELPPVCETTAATGVIPNGGLSSSYRRNEQWEERVNSFTKTRQVLLYLTVPEMEACAACRMAGKYCGFNHVSNYTFCISRHHGPSVAIIASATTAGVIIVVLEVSVLIFFYILRKTERDREVRLRVEQFLVTYGNAKPTRYTFAQVKKITKRFRNKLGQGGYGSVYKGELPNGIPVAVKMLESSRGVGEEFTNEVATIGMIHHVNIVRLLGFCSERSTRALIYEFMPNESLEKYIFSREVLSNEGKNPSLSMEKLLDIAIGIAQGIEYLHQGCQQRILHFDIKPHNILLDHDFRPKISDFGLAKLCSKEQSIVTMTAARGTMGYIAPEMYSRNFGTVSYKSDIYSFGMLMLEMVGGRKNLDPEIGKESEIYYPEWVYDRIVQRQDLGLAMEMEEGEEVTVKKLAIVALWCIQWSPTDRPSMSRVLKMLTGSLDDMQMPPKPFVSSSVDPAN